MKNVERTTPDQELNIDQIPASKVDFNMNSYRNTENSLWINFEELSKMNTKELSRLRPYNEKMEELDKKFADFLDVAEELLKEYKDILWEKREKVNRDSLPLVVTWDTHAVEIQVFDNDNKSYYNLRLPRQDGDYIAKLWVMDPEVMHKYDEDKNHEIDYDGYWYPVGVVKYYELDDNNYEKVLSKIEIALNNERKNIEKLKKEKQENLDAIVDGL